MHKIFNVSKGFTVQMGRQISEWILSITCSELDHSRVEHCCYWTEKKHAIHSKSNNLGQKKFPGDDDAAESCNHHFTILICSTTSFRIFTYIKINHNLTFIISKGILP